MGRGPLTRARAGPYHPPPEARTTPRSQPRKRWPSAVVDLDAVRDDRRLREARRRVGAVLEDNRRSLARLFESGLLFTRAGARLGRDLLLAHQRLLRVAALLGRLEALAARADGETEVLYARVQALLAHTRQLAERSAVLLAR